MPCLCKGQPSTPYQLTPTMVVWSWGPFPDYRPATEQELVDFLANADGTTTQ